MEQIYVLLTKTGTVFSKCVGLYTGKSFNHVSISLDKELNELYSFGRKVPWNPLVAGFVKEDIFFGSYAWFPDTTCEIYSIQVEPEMKEKIRQTIQIFEANSDNYKYNLLGCFSIIFNRPLNRHNAYFCSQFVSFLFKSVDLLPLLKNPGLVIPDDYRHLDEFSLEFEGNLYHYPHLKSPEVKTALPI